MKNRSKSGFSYSLLKRKMIVKVVLAAIVAAVVVVILREMSRGRLADALVGLIMDIKSFDYAAAEQYYRLYIGNNINLFMLISIFAFFLVAFRILIGSYTKYFDEVIVGIDSITHEGGQKIALSPELEFVEQKLNNVKETLFRQSQEALMAEQQKNDLVLYLAHDIKTPLTSVLGYLNLLDEMQDLPEAQRAKYIHIALEKAGRLDKLVNEFFEITRSHLYAVPLLKERLNLSLLIAQISDELYPQLAAGEREIELDIDGDLSVFGDPDKLARVFNNILKNALSYSQSRSTIYVSAEEEGGMTIIRFKSLGAIEQDKLELIFDKFSRLNAARSTETGGSGLGLAIARDIVSAHSGTIRAESDGSSTCFIVELPSL